MPCLAVPNSALRPPHISGGYRKIHELQHAINLSFAQDHLIRWFHILQSNITLSLQLRLISEMVGMEGGF